MSKKKNNNFNSHSARCDNEVFELNINFFSPENYISMFLLEALSANVKIFVDIKDKKLLNYFENSNFIFLNFSNEKKLLKKIIFYLNADFKMRKTKLKKNILNNINNKINHYLDEL